MPLFADGTKIISIFIQSVLYGAYVVLFGLTCSVLVYRRPRGRPFHKTMFGISLVMFTLATMHIAVNYTRIWKAFILYRDEPGGPAAFFNELSEFTQIFGSTIYITQTLVGDGVVLYRCYLVWGKKFVAVAVPCLLYLGSTVTGIGILYSFARIVPNAEIFASQLQQWIISFFIMTFATNVICTALVAFRIWYINRQTVTFTGYSLRPVIFLVVESGAVYSITLLVILILYKTKSWFQYVLVDAVSPIVGLVFSMIIIRIGLGITSAGGATALTSRGVRSSVLDSTALDFRSQIELGHSSTAPDDTDTYELTGSRQTALTGNELDNSLRPVTRYDDKKKILGQENV